MDWTLPYPSRRMLQHFGLRAGGTVYLGTADASGMMVSLIQTNDHAFGSGIVVPGTGIGLHNRGRNFGLQPGPPNEVGPGKKPLHTIIPGFVTTAGGAPRMSFGVMGGFMQAQGHVQMLSRLADFGQNPQAMIDAPRFMASPLDGSVKLEAGFNAATAEGLAARRPGRRPLRTSRQRGAPEPALGNPGGWMRRAGFTRWRGSCCTPRMRPTMRAPLPADPGDAARSGVAWQFTAESHDIDEFAAVQPDWSLRYQQLSSGRFAGQLQHVQLPGLRMVHEHASCATRQRGRLGSGQVGFAMPLALVGHAAFNGQPLSGDSIMIGRSEELDLCLPSEAGLIGVVVDFALLAQLWEHMYRKPLSAWIERQLVVQAMPAPAGALREQHLATLSGIAQRPELLADPGVALQLRDAILMEWIEAIPARVDTEDLAVGEARKRVVDRACDLMLSQPERPMTMLQVCDRIGASPRKLEYCFRSVLGISPAKYLRASRLDGVRRELRRGDLSSVQDVAARWGFWHLGEFAAAYRRQFGELPSQTLRERDER